METIKILKNNTKLLHRIQSEVINMKNNTKQVVILDNFSSPYIHQAILILKDYNPALEDKIIEEAERIVSGYLHPEKPSLKSEQKKLLPIIMYSISLAALAVFIITKIL